MTNFQIILAAGAFIVFAPTAAFSDDFSDGLAAYRMGDYGAALKLWVTLAEQGDAKAEYGLGVMYDNGDGVTEDDAKAVKWYRKAAELGHAKAQNNLGVMYDNGDGVAEDDVEAVKWYRKAATQGHPGAQNSLGLMYYVGRGVEKNLINAYAWVSIAAAGGDENAKIGKAIVAKEMMIKEIVEAQRKSAELMKTIKKPQE